MWGTLIFNHAKLLLENYSVFNILREESEFQVWVTVRCGRGISNCISSKRFNHFPKQQQNSATFKRLQFFDLHLATAYSCIKASAMQSPTLCEEFFHVSNNDTSTNTKNQREGQQFRPPCHTHLDQE